jgi:hypothetical protein
MKQRKAAATMAPIYAIPTQRVSTSNSSSSSSMKKLALYAAMGSLLLLAQSAMGQVGTTLCGCQPAVYEVTLTFDAECADANVGGPGINETACITSPETEENVTDFVPVLITNVQFLEQNGDFVTLQQIPINGDFRDGDIVTYTSVLAVQEPTEFTESTMPRAFQMILRGINALDQPIQVTWVITYDNDCGIFPILFEGQQMGWSVFVSSCTTKRSSTN